jgi:hypothetical protein
MKTGNGRRKKVFGQRFPFSLGRRLLSDTSGQVLLFGAILVVAILGFLLLIPNGTQVATQKVRAQTAADAGAFTGSIWLARTLNLSANMNVGIKGMYTWMTALTAAEALALALDSLVGTRGLACDMDSALFLNHDPRYVDVNVYPQAIRKLAETAQWLYVLQSDVDSSFPMVAQTLGSEQACRNASGGNPSSQNPGGMVLVAREDSLFVSDTSNLILNDLSQLGGALGSGMPPPLPDTTNVRKPTGSVTIDPITYEIKARYHLPSRWSTLAQKDSFYIYPPPLVYLKKRVWQFCDSANKEDTAYRDWLWPYGDWLSYRNGTLWIHYWLDKTHWSLVKCYDTTITLKSPGDVYFDSTFTMRKFTDMTDTAKWHSDSSQYWGPPYYPTSGKLLSPRAQYLVDMGYQVKVQQSYFTFSWDTVTAAESTNGNQGTRLRPSRLNPGRELHAVAYVWRQGDSRSPFGPSPVMCKGLFPRSRVAAASPLFTVARSIPYLTTVSTTQYDYFFNPAWDVKLTPLDSAGVQDITSDTAYASHSQNSFNLQDLRKYVVLP